MIREAIVGAAVWMASNPTGRKVAAKSYRVLSGLGSYAVRAMPKEVSTVLGSVENAAKDILKEEK